MKIVKYLKNPLLIINRLRVKKLFSKRGQKIEDEIYLKKAFKLFMGKKLNLKNPLTFSEKLQWLKLYNRKPEYTTMVDKYAVKEYIAEKIGEEHVIKTLGVWDRFDDIDFNALPQQFVLKTTHDSGGLSICRDKSTFDKEKAREKIEKSLEREYFYVWREWPYKDVKPRIIAEQYMEQKGCDELTDYKFYCFNGEPKFLYISQGLSNHETARIQYVSLDWEKMAVRRTDFPEMDKLPPKPITYDKMIEFSKTFSKNIPFLRVDFYEINGKLYFSELTFSPGAGLTKFEPESWDYKFGDWITLSEKGKIDRITAKCADDLANKSSFYI